MNWNHRIVRHINGDLEIVEVMYGRFSDVPPMVPGGAEFGWSKATMLADDEGDEPKKIDSLREQVEWFRSAIDKPILPAKGCESYCCKPADRTSAGQEKP